MAWYLDSALERHKKAPYTFYVPSPSVIEKLGEGDRVRLLFMSGAEEDYVCERMWVEITERDGDRFAGTLVNEPVSMEQPVRGETVHFRGEHVCDTEYKDPEEQRWDYYFDNRIVVSRDVLARKEFTFLLRDFPNRDGDTGWTASSGYEEEDYWEHADHLQVVSIGVVLNMDDSILEFIDDAPQCAYERDPATGRFVKVDDFDWDGYNNG